MTKPLATALSANADWDAPGAAEEASADPSLPIDGVIGQSASRPFTPNDCRPVQSSRLLRKALLPIGAVALAAALAGCRGKQEPDLTPEQQMNAIMEATSPFAEAEIRMDGAMASAVGVDAGDSWVRKMIEHHKGAIAIAQQVLAMSPDAHVAAMARATIGDERHELADLQKLVRQGPPSRASADLYQPAMDKMHQAVMAASGTSLSQTFHLKMLEQHRGAVAMSDVALANGVTGAVRDAVEKAKAHHLKQVEMFDAMLRNQARLPADSRSTDLRQSDNAVGIKPSA